MVDFLVIGPFGAVAGSNIFDHIKEDRITLGYNRVGSFIGGDVNSIWFTSLFVEERPVLILRDYIKEDYKKFDKFDAININRTEDIPDYDGLMGVPVTFLEKYNRNQFEIVGLLRPRLKDRDTILEGVYLYDRILIKRKYIK